MSPGPETGSGSEGILDAWVNLPVASDAEVADHPELRAAKSFFGSDGPSFGRASIAQLLSAMDAAGVERAYLTAGLHSGRHARLGALSIGVDEALTRREELGDRLRLIVDVDALGGRTPLSDSYRRLRELLSTAPEIVGVGIVPSLLERELNHPWMYPIYALCDELSVPVRINVGIFGPPMRSTFQEPLALEEILVDFPTLTVVGAHMGHPWEPLLIRLMMKFPRLHLMTSGYDPRYIAPEIIRFMASRRGTDRLLFASDWPVLDIARTVERAGALQLTDEVRAAYMGRNALRVFGWGRQPHGHSPFADRSEPISAHESPPAS